MTDPDRRRRRLSVALLIVVVVIAALGARYAASAADAANAVRRGTDLQACRALYRSDVDDADAVADVADAEAEAAADAAAKLFREGLVAAVTDGDVDSIVARIPAAEAEATEARQGAVDARRRVEVETDVYVAAVELSRDDPDRFLEQCAAGDS